jgi:hypothetical protein
VAFAITGTNDQPTLSNTTYSWGSGNQSKVITLTGTITDVDTGGTETVDVNWGDGSPHTIISGLTNGSSFSPTHEYSNSGTWTFVVTVTDQSGAVISQSGATSNKNGGTFPAGVAGTPINLGLDHPADAGLVTLTIANLPAGWLIDGATQQQDGTWNLQTADVASLTVKTPADFAGAAVLDLTLSWTNPDGSTLTATIADNVEVFSPENPIFAWNGDDNLTGSSGADTFVFSNPIGFDTIYSFDAAQDQVDLIGYDGFSSFQDVLNHLSSNADGDALLTLANGQTITLDGVAASSLSASNFVFNETPEVTNTGSLVIGNDAMLPLSGNVSNTGTIQMMGDGSDTLLQIIQRGITLTGGGTVVLSDDANNVISGTMSSVTLVNVDNTISGAGQLGAGMLSLDNRGTIVADGTNGLTIDTGANAVANSGTLAATGSGGLLVASAVLNTGLLWANGGSLTFASTVSGEGGALISGAGSIEFDSASSANVMFDSSAAGHLTLDAPALYTGAVSGFDGNDVIDLKCIDFSSVTSFSYAEDATHLGGVLTVWTAEGSTDLHLVGNYSQDDFALSADEDGSTLIGVHHLNSLPGHADLLM